MVFLEKIPLSTYTVIVTLSTCMQYFILCKVWNSNLYSFSNTCILYAKYPCNIFTIILTLQFVKEIILIFFK